MITSTPTIGSLRKVIPKPSVLRWAVLLTVLTLSCDEDIEQKVWLSPEQLTEVNDFAKCWCAVMTFDYNTTYGVAMSDTVVGESLNAMDCKNLIALQLEQIYQNTKWYQKWIEMMGESWEFIVLWNRTSPLENTREAMVVKSIQETDK